MVLKLRATFSHSELEIGNIPRGVGVVALSIRRHSCGKESCPKHAKGFDSEPIPASKLFEEFNPECDYHVVPNGCQLTIQVSFDGACVASSMRVLRRLAVRIDELERGFDRASAVTNVELRDYRNPTWFDVRRRRARIIHRRIGESLLTAMAACAPLSLKVLL